MVFDGFWFDGKSTKDFHMRVESYPDMDAPSRKIETVQVPGRNGDLHIEQDAFHNLIRTYDVYYHAPATAPAQAHAIKSWLMGAKGYRRLEDVYDPDHFYLAAFYGPLDISNQLNKYGRCSLQFDCKPQAFLKSGEAPLEVTGKLFNPTAFPSKPIIKIFGSGSGSITVGENIVTISEISQYVTLDCDTQNAYKEAENKNSQIYAPAFPVLQPGVNEITWSGGVTKIEIIPRWWEL